MNKPRTPFWQKIVLILLIPAFGIVGTMVAWKIMIPETQAQTKANAAEIQGNKLEIAAMKPEIIHIKEDVKWIRESQRIVERDINTILKGIAKINGNP